MDINLAELLKEVSKNPLVVSLFSLGLGSLVFNRWTQSRSDKSKRDELRAQLSEKIITDLNDAITNMWPFIRDERKAEQEFQEIPGYIMTLFKNRFVLDVKSSHLYQGRSFRKEYDRIIYSIELAWMLTKASKLNQTYRPFDDVSADPIRHNAEALCNAMVNDWGPLSSSAQKLVDAAEKNFEDKQLAKARQLMQTAQHAAVALGKHMISYREKSFI